MSHPLPLPASGASRWGWDGGVYRAEDTKLGREVALKFLPKELSEDTDARDRFTREARAASALDHPHICTIHEIDETPDGQLFIVMAHYNGETLKKKIERGPLPVDEAVRICSQIAEGLERAHEAGIIHRDIKPANVMVTSDGVTKIVDFGLAKLRPQTQDPETEVPADTLETSPGTLIGTVAYMSPEQARGKSVGKQADIWAFGCVLYETLSGVRAFRGDTVTDVLAGVIEREPEWELLPAPMPQRIRDVLKRCIRKNENDRLHDIADARILLQEVLERPANLTSEDTVATSRRKTTPGLLGIIGAVLGAVALTAAVMLLVGMLGQPVDLDSTRFAVNLPAGAQLHMFYTCNPLAISPDGKQLVFVATVNGTRKLFHRPIMSFDSAPLSGTEGAHKPVFSPDGSWVAFAADGKLKKVSLADGSVVTICDAPKVSSVCWASDNRILFTRQTKVVSVSASGGQPEIVSTIAPEPNVLSYSSLNSVPGGEAVILTARTGGGIENRRIDIVSTASGVRRTLINGGLHGQFSSSGHLVFSQGHSLMAAPFDLNRLELTGPAVPVLQGSRFGDQEAPFSALFRISETGTLVYTPNLRSQDGEPVWVDRQGRVERILEEPRSFWAPMISPDGGRLAMTTTEGVMETWILDLNRGALSRFSFQGSNHYNVWAPDGKQIAISSNRDGPFNLYLKPTDGSATTERLTVSDWHQDPGSWSPDGSILAFAQKHPETQWDIWLAHMGDNPQQEAFIRTRFHEHHPMISPDGRWLAYQSDETGRFEIYVQPFPYGGRKWLVSAGGGVEPLWARNGEELFYRNGNSVLVASIQPGPNFEAETPDLLFDGQFSTPGVWLPGLRHHPGWPAIRNDRAGDTGPTNRVLCCRRLV